MISPECTREEHDQCRGRAAFDLVADRITPCACLCHPADLPIERELRTARLILAMFEQQIAAYDAHMAKGRSARRFDIRHDLFDVTIIERIDGLRTGRTKWADRVAELEATIARGAS